MAGARGPGSEHLGARLREHCRYLLRDSGSRTRHLRFQRIARLEPLLHQPDVVHHLLLRRGNALLMRRDRRENPLAHRLEASLQRAERKTDAATIPTL